MATPPPPVDQSVVLIVIGPAVIATLVGALIYWLTHRKKADD